MLKLKNLALCPLVIFFAAMSSCGPVRTTPDAALNPGEPVVGAPTAGSNGLAGASTVEREPLKICVATDVSGSMDGTHTANVRAEDLLPLLDLLERVSGELGVALIGENDLPLLRVAVDARPVKPALPIRTDDGPEWARRVNHYREQFARYKTDEERWQKKVPPLIEAFKRDLSAMLSHERNDTNSRVLESIGRCDLFLNESDQVWGRATRRFLLAVSDGKDDYGPRHRSRKVLPLRSGATLYVINGNASTNSLASLQPQLVESLPAAVRQILAANGGEE
jgi:hypothetical protein